MASEQEIQTTVETSNETALSILAMLGGLGITLMVVAAGVGVVWENADSGLIGLIVMAGAGFLAIAIAGWVIIVRPHENFDDINEPMYHGHHHEEDHAEEDDAHAEH